MTLRDAGLAVVRAFPIAERLGRALYRRLPATLHDTPTSRAALFFRTEPMVTFVQIGAFDGLAGDPLRPLVHRYPGWRGVLVEPQPDVFARLTDNYAFAGARLRFVEAAIDCVAATRDLYRIPMEEIGRLGLPDWAAELASFDRAHVQRRFPEARTVPHPVKTLTFADVAALLPQAQVDFIVLDVEGYEHAILKTIDFDRHQVRFLIFEHKHMDADVRARVGSLLADAGFQFKAFGRDTIAWRVGVSKTKGQVSGRHLRESDKAIVR